MPWSRQQFWVGVAVALFGLVGGVSNFYRGLGEGSRSRDLIVGNVCPVLAIGWLIRVIVAWRGESD